MPTSIKIRGIAPPDVQGLPSVMRRQFWALVAPIALKVKDQELAAGLDANGDPLKPISPRTRKYRKSAMDLARKGPALDGPPLMPARQKSRTRALLAARVVGDTHVELYWRFDPFTGDQQSRILTFQREQGRDVFGVSPDGMAAIRKQAAAAWTKWKKLQAEPEKYLPAFVSHAITSGQPQSRIAVTIANSALPGAGSRAGVPVVGTTVRGTITRGIGAPTRAELKAGQYSGGKTAEGWKRHFTEEVRAGKSGGGVVATPTAARAAMKPKAPPKSTPKPKTEQPKPQARPEPLSVSRFAMLAQAAARAVPESQRYGDKNVWIIDAFASFQSIHPEIGLIEYKRMLIEANMARLITLARNDLPQAVPISDRWKIEASETVQSIATFHWIRV